ncbi:hypothetical protein niasHT_002640 [Heterodera trifolii]|uniref:Uncharacterized protein n=1 Tax=Heterodera trifolii TaxID=157864 RepID=A0ABD2LU81_9BILA
MDRFFALSPNLASSKAPLPLKCSQGKPRDNEKISLEPNGMLPHPPVERMDKNTFARIFHCKKKLMKKGLASPNLKNIVPNWVFVVGQCFRRSVRPLISSPVFAYASADAFASYATEIESDFNLSTNKDVKKGQ